MEEKKPIHEVLSDKNATLDEKYTPKWLRKFEAFKGVSDEKALEMIETMKTYCRIICKTVSYEQFKRLSRIRKRKRKQK